MSHTPADAASDTSGVTENWRETLDSVLVDIRENSNKKLVTVDNVYVQTVLTEAINKLTNHHVGSDEILEAKKDTVVGLLKLIRLTSASRNSIPGQRGLGLEEAVAFSENYLRSGVFSNREINLTLMLRNFSKISS